MAYNEFESFSRGDVAWGKKSIKISDRYGQQITISKKGATELGRLLLGIYEKEVIQEVANAA